MAVYEAEWASGTEVLPSLTVLAPMAYQWKVQGAQGFSYERPELEDPRGAMKRNAGVFK